MPFLPRSRCPRCKRLHDDRGLCVRCRGQVDRRIKQASPWRWVYNDQRWRELRDQVLSEEPVCRCGCGRPSTVVDHIKPHRGDPDLAFDRANCQGMAKPCHDAKTARESWHRQ